ncbi:hypothetical protein [Bogoriella caseilytica]|uniref:Anti-sigma-K factor rskA n=1 Tax=Bogoriella caseilytica TaxID=56055 RepID=A0A3N2BBH0_9MICO|nr:hypothetical protein [Bogoriella caseilytica]ROR72609.1 hypothetical protein EDD31_0965 [Bogoriella caseilytica]
MTADEDRRAELVAAALAGELSTEERAELDAMAASDPTVQAELTEMAEMLSGVRNAVPSWHDESPPPALRARVLEAAHAEGEAGEHESADHVAGLPGAAADAETVPAPAAPRERSSTSMAADARRRRHSSWALVACFLAGVLVTVGGYVGATTMQGGPPDGPPGTLGAIEEVSFDRQIEGARIDGVLVAHTWGTETILEIEGLPAGEGYALVLIDEDGQEYHSGTFFGSDVVIDCRMNAAVMRAEVDRLEIREEAGGVLIAASLPDAVDDRG